MNDYNINEMAHKANKAATKAAVHAQKGRHYKKQFDKDFERLTVWRAIMSNEAIRKFTIIFLVALTLEIIFSFRIYEAVFTAQQNQNPSVILPLSAGLFIAALAALNSHLLSLSRSDGLRKWMIYNQSEVPGVEKPRFEITEEINKKATRHQIYGVIFLLFLISLVLLGSYARVEAESILRTEEATLLTIIDVIMPVIAIIAEVITGIYLVYLMKYSALKLRVQRNYQRYQKHLEKCIEFTQYAYSLVEEAKLIGVSIAPTHHLKEAAFRVLFRSADRENYLDEITDFRHDPDKVQSELVVNDI